MDLPSRSHTDGPTGLTNEPAGFETRGPVHAPLHAAINSDEVPLLSHVTSSFRQSLTTSSPTSLSLYLYLFLMESVDEDVLVAAAALLLLASLPDRPPAAKDLLWEPDPQPSTEAVAAEAMSIEMTPSIFLPIWGVRSRRSRCVCKSKREREEEESSAAAAAAAVACNRQSPATPHDFATVSDPSTSDSDGLPNSCEKTPVKGLLSGDTSALSCGVYKKVSAVEPTFVEAVDTSSRLIRNRRHGRKKTLIELQSHERLLMEEKTALVKLVESKRKEVEALNAENKRLKRIRTNLQRAPSAAEEAKPAILLPDLNEPVMLEGVEC